MVEFEKERKKEKETFAIINFFQLLSQAQVAENSNLPKKTFLAIGGLITLERLIKDCKEDNIDIFANSVGTLFKQLEQNIKSINSITWSKSDLIDEALDKFELFKNFYSVTSGVNEEAYLDLAILHSIPEKKIIEILDNRTRGRN